MERVSVEFEYEYTTRDGRLVSIKPNDNYLLISKTTDHWWHVRRDPQSRPFYVPAQYVRELHPPADDPSHPDPTNFRKNDELPHAATLTPAGAMTQVCVPAEERPGDPDPPLGLDMNTEALTGRQASASSGGGPAHFNRHCFPESRSLSAGPLDADDVHTRPRRKHTPKGGPRPRPQETGSSLCEGPPPPPPPGDPTKTLDDDGVKRPPSNGLVYDKILVLENTESDSLFGELWVTTASDDPALGQSPDRSPDINPNGQADNESLDSAVYGNVGQLCQSFSESPPSVPLAYSPSSADAEGWEVHTDRETGQDYYFHPATGHTTWDNPLYSYPVDPEPLPGQQSCSPVLSRSPAPSPPPASPGWASDWEKLVDETSGRPYFYNAMSGETSWELPELLSPYPALMEPPGGHRPQDDVLPPLPEEDYPQEDYPAGNYLPEVQEEPLHGAPATLPKEYTLSHVTRTIIPRASLDRSTPAGWNLTVDSDGTWVFTREHSHEQWIKSLDDHGQSYYYLRDGSKSQWNLPEVPAPGQAKVGNGIEADSIGVLKNWRHSMSPTHFSSVYEEEPFVPGHRRDMSDYGSDSSSTGNSPETQHHVQNLEKAGILNKTKVCENGKKVRKNWGQSWTVLHGGVLTFHKDPKSTAAASLNKTNQIVPEVRVDLRGAAIGWASRDKSSKKNVLELKSKIGVEFLIQYDNDSIISDWFKVIVDTIRQLEYQDHHSEEEDVDFIEKSSSTEREDRSGGTVDRRRSSRPPSSSSVGETDQKRVRTKLIKFLMKRPTLQSVKEKGYIRDNVFGCHLATLCAQERTTVPRFVDKCIRAVEKRGLDIDGLYRVSGNLAVIQKLRYKADHEELDLEDGQWEDVHVITGALKLFFRELPEPLFPYGHFNSFIGAIRTADFNTKVSYVRNLVKSLPQPNHDTMELLFGHLHKVIAYGDENRMTVQNVAIVFGPTLLRPEMESSNIAMHMIFQNQIVELILNEYQHIFS